MDDKEKFTLYEKLAGINDYQQILTLFCEELEKAGFLSYRIDILDDEKENLVTHEITVQIFEKGEPFFIHKENISHFNELVLSRFNQLHLIENCYLPLVKDSQKIGILICFNFKTRYSQEEIKKLSELKDFFFPFLLSSLSYRKLENQKSKTTRLIEINQKLSKLTETINTLASIENIYDIIIREICEIFHFQNGTVYIRDGNTLKIEYINPDSDDGDLLTRYFEILGPERSLSLEKDLDMGPVVCFKGNRTIYYSDVQTFILSEKTEKIRGLFNIRSVLSIPLRIRQEPFGVLQFITQNIPVYLSDIELELISSLSDFAGSSISNAALFSKVENQKKELEEKDLIITKDLKMAKRIQENIISADYKKINDLDFYIRYEPQSQIGGDIYDIFELKKGYYRIFLSDATGHGVQAALTTMVIINEYSKVKNMEQKPDFLMKTLNQSFIEKYYKLTVFFTSIILDIDLNEKKIFYSCAGHPAQYLIRNKEIVPLKTEGKIVGIFENSSYELGESPISQSDKIFLFTDGLFEAFNRNEEEYGEERLYQSIQKNAGLKISQIGENVCQEVQKFLDGNLFDDDLSVIGIEIK